MEITIILYFKFVFFHRNVEEEVYIDISPCFNTSGEPIRCVDRKMSLWTKTSPSGMVMKIHKGVFEL